MITKRIFVMYLDNIIIFTQTLKEHVRAVQRVLKILAKYKLFLYIEKCEFEQKQIKYSGLVIPEK